MNHRSVFRRGIDLTTLIRCAAILLVLQVVAVAVGQVQKDPYKLGAEDVITIAVRNHQEFSGDALVPADGILDLPVLGPTKVAGLSLDQVRAKLQQALANRIVNPEVNIFLKIPRVRRVYVEGAVKASLPVDYKPGFRISECLAGVGGLADTIQAVDCHVTVLRAETNKVEEVALADVYAGKKSANLPVFPGDVVTVKAIEAIPVYVVGQVKTPGVIRMRLDQVGLLSSIAMAGGLLPTASTANVTITHVNGQVKKVDISGAILNGDKTSLPKLESGDLISVPELQSHFAVTGLVKTPGIFPIGDGKTVRLSDAIAIAGGNDTKRARMSRIAVLRNDNGKMKRMIVNYGQFLSKGDDTQNIFLQAGDVIYVPETNSIDWSSIFAGIYASYYIVNATKN